MNLKKISTLCFAASTLVAASSVMAWESADGAFSTSASVALSSEYVWRGITQTDSEPAISGSFDVAHSSGAYAGVWASNVDFGDNTSIEIDYYAGFGGEFGESGVSYDIGGLYYNYPDQSDLDFFEFYGSVGYSFVTAGVSYSQDLFGTEAQDDLYYTLGAAYDVGMISLAAGIGYYDFDSGDDYTNYHIGASTELAGFGLDLTYTDTDDNADDLYGSNAADSALIFTISKSM
ncbi:MAG: TorF family putative porin [Pseudomonadota bacterium]|nr:TorF family putative porin [Pseudomonadota bacterium]MDO7711116.1 TorF family putative porin [Pseudomonadota bacterium]